MIRSLGHGRTDRNAFSSSLAIKLSTQHRASQKSKITAKIFSTHTSPSKATQKPFFASHPGIGAGVKFEFRVSPLPRGRLYPSAMRWSFIYLMEQLLNCVSGAVPKTATQNRKLFSEARLRCAAPCQFRCRGTWPASRYLHLSQAAFAHSVRSRCLSSVDRA